jgi:plasmid maintenance system antidote protein VapI
MDIRMVDPTYVDDDQLGMQTQHEIYSWVMNNEIANSHWQVGDLDLSPRTLYRFIDGLVCALIGRNLGKYMVKANGVPVRPMIRDAKKKRSLPPEELFSLYATAMKALENWPHGFHELLDVYASNSPKVGSSGLLIEFGALYKKWISLRWKKEQFSFLQDEFIRYLESNGELFRPRGRANRYQRDAQLTDKFSSKAISLKDATRILKINPEQVKALVELGHLRRYSAWKEDPGWHKLLIKGDVLRIAEEVSRLLNLRESAEALGVSENYLRGMIKHQLILPEGTPASLIRRGVLISQEVIKIFMDRLWDNASPIFPPDPKFVDLHDCARILTKIRVNSFQVLKMLLAGKLTYYFQDGLLSVRSLRFDRDDLEAYIETEKEKLGLVTRHEIAAHLGITLKQVSAMIKAGNLQMKVSFGTTKYFARSSLD